MKMYRAKFYVLFLLLTTLICASPAFAQDKGKEGMLLVMFGTSYESAKNALDAIEAEYIHMYKGRGPVEVAYTSEKIREKLRKRGEKVFSIDEAMHALAVKGVTHLSVQSFHVTPAAEYNETERLIVKHLIQNPQHFTKATLGAPLLVSTQDMHKVIAVILGAIPQERMPEDAVLFMGHGNDHGPGDLVLQATASALNAKDSHAYLACVEGGLTFDSVLKKLKAKQSKRVWLMPFMIVAGDHAVNDLVGEEEDSWASRLKKEGFEVKSHVMGLGQLQGIRDIFLEHTKNAHLELTKIRQAQ